MRINSDFETAMERIFGAEIQEKKKRPKMMDKPDPHYEHEWSRHPDWIRVSFEDGSTAVYYLQVEQPAPVIIENIKIIRKWKQGYVNQPETRRGKR